MITLTRPGWLRWAAAVCLWLASAGAMAQPLIALDSQRPGPFFLDSQVLTWYDASGRATLDDVLRLPEGSFQPPPDRKTLPLVPEDAMWFKLAIGPSASLEPWLLTSYLPAPDYVSAYLQDAGGRWREQRAGDRIAVREWPMPETRPTFRIDPRRDASVTVYVRVSDRLGSFTRFRLARFDAWAKAKDENTLMFGLYFGVAMLIFSVCIACWIAYRDRTFGSYAAYTLAMALAQSSFSGLGGRFLYPGWPLLNDYAIYLWISVAVSLAVLFALHVGSAWALARRWAWFMLGCCCVLWLALLVFSVWRNASLFLAISAMDGLLGLMALVSLAITWRNGDRYSAVLLAAFLPLLISATPLILYNYRVIDSSFWTQYSLMLGSAFECVLLFFILIWRSRDRAVTLTRSRALEKYDPLTGLANLRTLLDRLYGMQIRSHRMGHDSALAVIEMTNYEELRSELGDERADLALVLAARHLGAVAHDVDTPARIGPALFALAVEGPATLESVSSTCSALMARGLRPQRLLPGGEVLEFRMVVALFSSSEHEADRIVSYLVRALRDLDPGSNRRIQSISLDALSSMPASIPRMA